MNQQNLSTRSSSKSQRGLGAKKEGSSAYEDEQVNPFKLPSDELIWSFKETEKDQKIIEREKNKQLRIWEKNKPIREGLLRKICETDIEPTQIAINQKIESKVNLAEAAGFTIPVERPKNKENRWKLIEKKREMFLVELMLGTKSEEIAHLKNSAALREDGLLCSENMLETDTKAFLEFFKEIKDKTDSAQKAVEDTRRQKAKLQADLADVSNSIQVLISKVSKDVEHLEQYYKYKLFLDELAQKYGTPDQKQKVFDEIAEVEAIKKHEKETEKKDTEKKVKTKGKITSQEGKREVSKNRKHVDAQEKEETTFEKELLIGAEIQAIYENPRPTRKKIFEESQELTEIFSQLEENNLLQIQRMQEAEQQLEMKRQQKFEEETKLKNEIQLLEENKAKLEMKIAKEEMDIRI